MSRCMRKGDGDVKVKGKTKMVVWPRKIPHPCQIAARLPMVSHRRILVLETMASWKIVYHEPIKIAYSYNNNSPDMQSELRTNTGG